MNDTQTILVVDDEEALSEMMVTILEYAGYHAITASSRTEALAIAEQWKDSLKLLIVDSIMPSFDGRELATWMHKEYPNLAILLISGEAERVVSAAAALGPRARALPKPFTFEQILDAVRELLEQQKDPSSPEEAFE